MRIAIYAGIFRKDQDGATKTLYRLIDTLLTSGVVVGVWGFSVTPWDREGLRLFTLPSLPCPLYRDYRVAIPTRGAMRELADFAPDLIHVTVPDFVGSAFVRFARESSVPVISTYHTVFPAYLRYFKIGFLTKRALFVEARFYKRLDAVYVPSDVVAGSLRRRGVERVKIWSRGVDTGQFSPGARSPAGHEALAGGRETVILYVGRFVGYKDVDVLADVYRLFHNGHERAVRFVLAGSGPQESVLRKRMPEAVFTGYLHGEDLARVYANSDILLFPSQTESFGNVILEALASGIPAVVSNRGGCQEIVNLAGAGLVARSGDAADFHRQCLRLIGDRDTYDRMRRRGIEFARSRTWETISASMVREIKSFAARRPEQPFPDRNPLC